MKKVIELSKAIFYEYFREKVFYLIFFVAIGMLLFSFVFQEMVVGEEGKVFKDMALSSITLFAVAIPIFITSQMISSQIYRRSIYLLLSLPVTASSLIVAHLLASLYIIGISILALFLLALAVMLPFGLWAGPLLIHSYLSILAGMVLSSWALFFSSVLSSTLSAITTAVIYFVGSIFDAALDYVRLRPSSAAHYILEALKYMVPNMGFFDLKPELVYSLPYPRAKLLFAVIYALSQTFLLTYIAAWALSRREI